MPKNTIKINLHEEQPNSRLNLTYSSSQFLIAGFFYLMSVVAFLDAFKFPDVSFYGIFVGLILIAFFFFIQNKKIKTYGGLSLLLLMTFLFVILNKYTVNGFFLSLNHLADAVGKETAYVLPKYKILIEPESFKMAINLFMIYLFMLISYLSYLIVSKSLSFLVWIFMFLILIFQLVIGIYFDVFLNIGLFLASLLIINTSFINRENSFYYLNKKRNFSSLFTSFILMSVVFLTLLITITIQPEASYKKNVYVETIEKKANDKLENLRYEKGIPDSFTQGDFLKLSELELTDLEALEIIMEKPTTYYLRGFIGADYSRNAWTVLNNEAIYDNYGLFYFLNESGFKPLSQLSLVDEITHKDEDEIFTQQMTINNLNASSKYLYTPYEINDSLVEIDDLHYFNESHLVSKKFKGERQYSFNTNENLVTHYPAIANRLYENKNNEKVKRYLDHESYYNQYVYDYYTELPKEVENILSIHFRNKTEEKTHLAYEQAISLVKEYLTEAIDYNEKPKELNENRDFLSFIIEDSNEGYAPHYATTGTLLFRYLGIPARYVEGYLVTPDVIKDKEPFDKLTITGQEAHAWTEIYFDELGWIPIEVTPTYENVMPEIDLTDYPKGDGSDEEEQVMNEKKEKKASEDKISKSNKKDDEKINTAFFKLLLILLIIILLLLILIYLAYLIKKRLELRKLTKSFVGKNLNKATKLITSYTLVLFHYAGIKERKGSIRAYETDIKKSLGAEFASDFREVLKINEAAVYSGRETSEVEHEFVLEFKDKLLTKVLSEKTFWQKIKMRFWDFIY